MAAGHSAVPCKPLPVDGAVHRQIDKELQELRRGPGQQRGLDKRCTITTALKDPDAADGGEERYSIDNVAFTELPFMNYKMGEVNQQKLPFTFRPSDLVCLDSIRAAD